MYADGIWVAGISSGNYYSFDGKNWYKSNITSGLYTSIKHANGIWVAGSSSEMSICYSVTWEPST